jgi:hypothetical protein
MKLEDLLRASFFSSWRYIYSASALIAIDIMMRMQVLVDIDHAIATSTLI